MVADFGGWQRDNLHGYLSEKEMQIIRAEYLACRLTPEQSQAWMEAALLHMRGGGDPTIDPLTAANRAAAALAPDSIFVNFTTKE